jgi:hypothetical protein
MRIGDLVKTQIPPEDFSLGIVIGLEHNGDPIVRYVWGTNAGNTYIEYASTLDVLSSVEITTDRR